jgi:hypothetical protein
MRGVEELQKGEGAKKARSRNVELETVAQSVSNPDLSLDLISVPGQDFHPD